MELKFVPFCSSLDAFSDETVLLKSNFSVSGRKPWTIVRHFNQVSLHNHNSSLEGATELKFAAAPLEMPFPMALLFAEIDVLCFWPTPWTIVRHYIKCLYKFPCYCSLEGVQNFILCYSAPLEMHSGKGALSFLFYSWHTVDLHVYALLRMV